VNRDPAITRMAQGVEQRESGMGRGGGILAALEIEGEPGSAPRGGYDPIVDRRQRIIRRGKQAARKSCAHAVSPHGGSARLRASQCPAGNLLS
jgi:hypothetical protein